MMSAPSDKADKAKRRSDMACTRCRARKLKCENKDSVAPCKRCEAENQGCIFMSVADDAGAMGPKPPKTPNTSRGSSEEGRSNHSITPTHVISPVSLPTGRPQNQTMSPTHVRGSFHTPPSGYYPHRQPHQGRPQASNSSPPNSERSISGFGPSYRPEGSFPPVDRSQNPWPGSNQPVYSGHPSMGTPYVDQGSSRPSVPIPPAYSYSSPSDPTYTPTIYGSEHEPRTQGYYNSGDAAHESSTTQHQYYLANTSYQHNPQPSGLPGYPDPNIISNGQQDGGNDYYYTR